MNVEYKVCYWCGQMHFPWATNECSCGAHFMVSVERYDELKGKREE